MPDLITKIRSLFAGLIPTKRVTIYNRRYDPPAMAHTMDAEGIHSILRSAENGDTTDLFALYRDVIASDNHLQTVFALRKLAVLGDPLNIQPIDPEDPADAAAAEAIQSMIDDCDDWTRAVADLMDSVLYPVAVAEKVFRPSVQPGLRFDLSCLRQVPYQLFNYQEGDLRIHDTDPNGGQKLGTYQHPDPTRYIIHRGHLLSLPDHWGGPMRSILFWWLFSTQDRDWWARFLDRYGAPFLVGKYDQSDDQSRGTLERAFSAATRLFGVVISKETEIELKEAASSSTGEAYEKFHQVAQREKSKLVLGQTLSTDADATGLGSGVANAQAAVRQDIRQFDSMMLASTLRRLFRQYLLINGIPGRPPKAVWGSESYENAEATGQILQSLSQSGLDVADESLPIISERLGFQVIRRPTPAPPNNLLPFSADARVALTADDANDRLARNASADLARAFSGAYAPVRRILAASTGPDDLERRLRDHFADLPDARQSKIIEEALIAYAANGLSADAG